MAAPPTLPWPTPKTRRRDATRQRQKKKGKPAATTANEGFGWFGLGHRKDTATWSRFNTAELRHRFFAPIPITTVRGELGGSMAYLPYAGFATLWPPAFGFALIPL